MAKVFSENILEKIQRYLKRYETKRSAIIPILHLLQEEYGWINEDQVAALDLDYGLSRVHVQEVLTFYSEFTTVPPKKYRIMICDSISCVLMGERDTVDKIKHLKKRYHKDPGKCPFVLEEVPCLGKCDGAPVVIINNKRHECVSADKVDEIFSQYEGLL